MQRSCRLLLVVMLTCGCQVVAGPDADKEVTTSRGQPPTLTGVLAGPSPDGASDPDGATDAGAGTHPADLAGADLAGTARADATVIDPDGAITRMEDDAAIGRSDDGALSGPGDGAIGATSDGAVGGMGDGAIAPTSDAAIDDAAAPDMGAQGGDDASTTADAGAADLAPPRDALAAIDASTGAILDGSVADQAIAPDLAIVAAPDLAIAPPDLAVAPPDLALAPRDMYEARDLVVVAGDNPIVRENQLPGDSGWQLAQPSRSDARDVEGYAGVTSIMPGGSVDLHVSLASAGTVTVTAYRIGDYGGVGARRVASFGPFAASPQPVPTPDATTHLVECAWPRTATIPVGSDWVLGIYLLKLHASSGYEAYVPLVVRDARSSALLFVESVNTWQAYNQWGGWSLYGHPNGDGSLSPQAPEADRVSYDRPYGMMLAGDTYYDTAGAATFLLWDVYIVRWLEAHGYDVSYASDVDVDGSGAISGGGMGTHRAAISPAHSEYWSWGMRDGFTGGIASGVSVAFLGANTAFWRVRLEPSSSGTPSRIVTCYKDDAGDPMSGTDQATDILWRNAGYPEAAFVGVMYDTSTGNVQQTPMRVENAQHWIFAGTGLSSGDTLSDIVGYEFDRVYDGVSPSSREILGATMTPFGVCSNMTYYVAASGAQVFATGTIGFALGLGDSGSADPRVGTILGNVLGNMITPVHGATSSAVSSACP